MATTQSGIRPWIRFTAMCQPGDAEDFTGRRVQDALVLCLRFGLGLMFLWSSLPKLQQPYDFLSTVYGYELVGPKLGLAAAVMLPWLEFLLGMCLITGLFLDGALLLTALLAVVFTFVQASAIARGLDITCGCFSSLGGEPIGSASLARAALVLLAATVAYAAGFSLVPIESSQTSRNAGSRLAEPAEGYGWRTITDRVLGRFPSLGMVIILQLVVPKHASV